MERGRFLFMGRMGKGAGHNKLCFTNRVNNYDFERFVRVMLGSPVSNCAMIDDDVAERGELPDVPLLTYEALLEVDH